MRRKAFIKSDVNLKELRVLNESEVRADAVCALLPMLPSFQFALEVLHGLIEIWCPLVGENESSGLILGGGKLDPLMLSSVEFQLQLLKADEVALCFEALRVQPVEQIEDSSSDCYGQNSNDQPLGTIQRKDVIPAITERRAHSITSAPNNPTRFSNWHADGDAVRGYASRSMAIVASSSWRA